MFNTVLLLASGASLHVPPRMTGTVFLYHYVYTLYHNGFVNIMHQCLVFMMIVFHFHTVSSECWPLAV